MCASKVGESLFQGRTQTDRGEVTQTHTHKSKRWWIGSAPPPLTPPSLFYVSHCHGNHQHLRCILHSCFHTTRRPSFSSPPLLLMFARRLKCAESCSLQSFSCLYHDSSIYATHWALHYAILRCSTPCIKSLIIYRDDYTVHDWTM